MRPTTTQLLDEAWRFLGGDPARTPRPVLDGPGGTLPARLPVNEMAAATAAAAGLAAAELAAARGLAGPPAVRLDTRGVAIAFTGERHLRLDGAPQVAMDPLSRFLPCADGHVRLHGNYPHHRAALSAALGVDATGSDPVEPVTAVLAGLTGAEIEERAAAHGALAFAVRSPRTWAALTQGQAAGAAGLLTLRRTGAADRSTALPPLRPGPAGPLLPASGVRVVDLTRVIAGPVGTRTLALLGADVLRVDPPGMPEIPGQHLDTGFGKRSAVLDLRRAGDLELLEGLLAEADVAVTGYRPGGLDAFGLGPDELGARHPHLVTARLSAWGTVGPWAGRRGFDSLVQAACGIAHIEADGDEQPGVLPAQALDHGTGYLLAAGVLRGLAMREADGRGTHVELALARTAAWLTAHHDPAEHRPHMPARTAPGPWLSVTSAPYGELRHALPAFAIEGGPRTWSAPPVPWGSSEPVWRPRD